MERVIERGAALDVHKKSVTACVRVPGADGGRRQEVQTFGTTAAALLALRDWLGAHGVTHVAMESTGVYWKPIHALLEDGFEVVVGNAYHIKAVPGRKTDVKDAEWLADLLRHGLISKSFVPPRPIRVLRDLVRYRRRLVGSRTAERNRLLKLLETANIKLSSVVCDVFGVSGKLMLRALLEGRSKPEDMAQLARGRMRRKIGDLELALDGRLDEHHRFLLALQLRRLRHRPGRRSDRRTAGAVPGQARALGSDPWCGPRLGCDPHR